MFKGPIKLQNGDLTPIHFSKNNGVHADFIPYDGSPKVHIPYIGQTTLDMFNIGMKPNYDSYNNISELNLGSLDVENSY